LQTINPVGFYFKIIIVYLDALVSDKSNSTNIIESLESLQRSYSNIKIYTAVPMGVLMILYFFSFAMLIDKGMNSALMFEIVTSILFVLYFVYINRAAFAMLKFLNRNKSVRSNLLSLMDGNELAMKSDALAGLIESRR